MLEAAGTALASIFTGQHFAMMMLGVITGLVLGIIPGLGGYVGVALLLPIVLYMDPTSALVTILAMHAVVTTGGSVTAVLFGVPGTGQNVATVFDGFPLNQQGKGALATGAAISASALGGLIGAVVLFALIPVVRPLVMAFGTGEFFLMVMLGIACVVVMATETPVKGFIMAGLGFLVSLIGQDVATGAPRFVFGLNYLWDGLKLNPVVLGQVAISEMVLMAAAGGTIATAGSGKVRLAQRELFEGFLAVLRHWMLLIKSSIIGVVVGIIPGLGGEAATLIAYGAAKQGSRESEKFGTGAIEGVIAPEAANNSKEGGVLLPTLAFGVAGSGVMAILLGVFIIFGITPGKQMLTDYLPLTMSMAWTVALANVFGAAIMFMIASYLVPLTRLPVAILMPVITILIMIGSYSTYYSVSDLVTTLVFAAFGCYAWKKCGYPIAPFILAFILGEEAERNFRVAIATHGPLFFLRPISLVLLIILVLLLAYAILRRGRKVSRSSAGAKEGGMSV